MSERPGAVTFKGGPLTLVGDELAAGQAAPDFTLVTNLSLMDEEKLKRQVMGFEPDTSKTYHD